MKKFRLAAILTAVTVLAVSVLTGCSSKPTAQDAQKYTQAVLDLMCKGDYDHSVKLADIEEGKETEVRDQMVQEALDTVASNSNISDERKNELKEVLIEAFGKCKYTVGDAVKTDNDEFDVTVTIEPLRIFARFETELSERFYAKVDDPASLTEDERNDLAYSVMIEIMRENLVDPTYEAGEEVIAHYGLIDKENNLYGISEEDGQKMGELLFSASFE